MHGGEASETDAPTWFACRIGVTRDVWEASLAIDLEAALLA